MSCIRGLNILNLTVFFSCFQLRYYRANQAIMDKASMLYNRLKNSFLVGEGEEVVSAAFLQSLLQENERGEEQRVRKRREEEGEKAKTEGKCMLKCTQGVNGVIETVCAK